MDKLELSHLNRVLKLIKASTLTKQAKSQVQEGVSN